MAGGIDMTKLKEIEDDALRKAEQGSSHELGHFITSQILRGQLKEAHNKISRLEQENSEWRDLLGKLKDFDEWKRWKIGEG